MENSTNSTVNCITLIKIGYYCIVLFVLSILSNTVVIVIFIRNKKFMNHVNLLIIFLSILNLIGTIIELPMVTISAFNCHFVFGRFGCIFEAFTQ
jgi:hypothetical protein